MLLLLFTNSAYAACTNPEGVASLTRYDFTANKLYYCNDTAWVELGGGSLPALSSARLWVGNASNTAAAVTLSGDATLSNTGVLTLAPGSVTTAEIAADTITAADIAPNAVTSSELADNAVTIPKLAATGTASASTYLRGDNTWAAVAAGSETQGSLCGLATKTASTSNCTSNTQYSSKVSCNGTNLANGTCPSGFTLRVTEVGATGSCGIGSCYGCIRTCSKN